MPGDVIPLYPEGIPSENIAAEVLSFFLEEKRETTARAYLKDLGYLQQYLNMASVLDVVRFMLDSPPLLVNRRIQEWKYSMEHGGDNVNRPSPLAPRTVNRRLATVRSLLRCATKLGLSSTPSLSVRDLPDYRVKDLRAPGVETIARMMEILGCSDSPKAARDRAILALASILACRREEISNVNLEDLDLSSARIRISSKGGKKSYLSLPPLAHKALAIWFDHRVSMDTPSPALFINLASNSRQERLSTTSVYRVIRSAGELAGSLTPVRPHGLRRCAINQVVARYGLVRAAQFARHRDIRSTMQYVDPDEEEQAEIREHLATGLEKAFEDGEVRPDISSGDRDGASQ